jgi:hypothetical protein
MSPDEKKFAEIPLISWTTRGKFGSIPEKSWSMIYGTMHMPKNTHSLALCVFKMTWST